MPIDWSVFDAMPESTCECRCGATFRSHVKFVTIEPRGLQSRMPCPACGGHAMRRATTDPETETIRGQRPAR